MAAGLACIDLLNRLWDCNTKRRMNAKDVSLSLPFLSSHDPLSALASLASLASFASLASLATWGWVARVHRHVSVAWRKLHGMRNA